MTHAIALDIGGTKIKGVLFNSKYKIIHSEKIYFKRKINSPTVKLPKSEVLKTINEIIDILKSKIKISDLKGIGISIPDIITKEGKISGLSKIKSFRNFHLANYLARKHKCKAAVANDADCFAYGEQQRGAGKNKKHVIGIIYGTGIGSGIIIDGKIYSGSKGSAGEFGHNIINPNGPKDRTGLPGTVESYVGGPNLVDRYIRAGGKIKNPDPKKIYSSKEGIAKKIVKETLDYFAIGLSSLTNILNPEVIILGGGQSNLPIYKKINKLTKKYSFSSLKKNVKIVKNKLGDDAGIYGAAALIFA